MHRVDDLLGLLACLVEQRDIVGIPDILRYAGSIHQKASGIGGGILGFGSGLLAASFLSVLVGFPPFPLRSFDDQCVDFLQDLNRQSQPEVDHRT